jgi:hypothetical protein
MVEEIRDLATEYKKVASRKADANYRSPNVVNQRKKSVVLSPVIHFNLEKSEKNMDLPMKSTTDRSPMCNLR